MTIEELRVEEIYQWSDIRRDYEQPDLLIGNGFTMNFSDSFSYDSLFTTFLNNTDAAHRALFPRFDTTNFELILKYLSYTNITNTILGLDTVVVTRAIDALKNGLIQTIRQVHPQSANINWTQIDKVTRQLGYFGDVFTLNYDLYLYHIIMHSNDIHNTEDCNFRPYQDYFWGDHSNEYKKFMDFQDIKKYKHVYYLHGALFVFKHDIVDLKIKRAARGEELIDKIAREIAANHFPLFITEGTAADKLSAVNGSNYLNFCLEKLRMKDKPLVIFGTSLDPVDAHIVDAVKQTKRPLVIAIRVANKAREQILEEKFRFLTKFQFNTKPIKCIDAASLFDFVV